MTAATTMTPQQYKARATEAEYQAQLVQAARLLGYSVYHTTFSIGSDRGFPDLVIVGHNRLIVLEVKSEKGKVRPGQQEWIDAFASVPGVVARVVRPSDEDDVMAILSGEATNDHG
jgi:Holliday junction resolvase